METQTGDKPLDVGLIKDLIRQVLDEKAPKAQRTLTAGEQRVLNSLNWLEHITSKRAFPPPIVAYFASSTNLEAYTNHRKSLRQQRLVENTYGGFMKLTDAGRALSRTEMAISSKPQKREPPRFIDTGRKPPMRAPLKLREDHAQEAPQDTRELADA